MSFSRLAIALISSITLIVLTSCSFSSDSSEVDDSIPTSQPTDVSPATESPSEEVTDSEVSYDSVFELPGVSESTWSVLTVSDIVDGSTQFIAPGQVIVTDSSITNATFKVVSGSSVEIVDSLTYDDIFYSNALRVVSEGESFVEVVDFSGSVLFGFTVVS